MKTLLEAIFPETDLVPGVTGICEIDGRFTILDVQSPDVAIRFHDTNNVAVQRLDDVVHDEKKRRPSKAPLHWYSVAILLKGFTYPNGREVVDVRGKNRVLLKDGGCVKIDYVGVEPRIKVRAAYCKWLSIMQDTDNVVEEWEDFEAFQDWFIQHKPKRARRWHLRSADGTWGPGRCGFDDRTDLPVSSATLVGSVFTRP